MKDDADYTEAGAGYYDLRDRRNDEHLARHHQPWPGSATRSPDRPWRRPASVRRSPAASRTPRRLTAPTQITGAVRCLGWSFDTSAEIVPWKIRGKRARRPRPGRRVPRDGGRRPLPAGWVSRPDGDHAGRAATRRRQRLSGLNRG
jgi:hypothetical protein